MAPKKKEEPKTGNDKHPLEEEHGLSRASRLIEEFRKKRVYYIEPLTLALSTARRDPYTGMPGVPHGSLIEIAGAPGKGKSAIGENFGKHILNDPLEPNNELVFLNFEQPDAERWMWLDKKQGFDLNRIFTLDYSNPTLTKAEDGLNILIAIASEAYPGGKYPNVKACFIDSFGAMPVEKEIRDKDGNMKPVEKKEQMAARASIIKSFLGQWNTLNPNLRPTLVVINHMQDQIKNDGGFGIDPMKVSKIGEDLNYWTPGGWLFKFLAHMRIRADARKWPENKDAEKHEQTEGKIFDGLECILEIYRSKFLPGRHYARGILNMEDRTFCHFDREIEVLEVCSYLGIKGIQQLPRGRWQIGEENLSEEKARAYASEHMNELIVECAKPGNPERYHRPKSKKDKFIDADEEL